MGLLPTPYLTQQGGLMEIVIAIVVCILIAIAKNVLIHGYKRRD